MIRKKTVFVVGAGASCELGLPSGDHLKADISKALLPKGYNGYFQDQRIDIALISYIREQGIRDQVGEMGRYVEAAASMRKALPLAQSIDNYLHTYADNKYVNMIGKIGIASAILSAEDKSALRIPLAMDISTQKTFEKGYNDRLLESWYSPLGHLLMSGIQRDHLHTIFDDVKFIVFNYDRCLEHYLMMMINRLYGKEPNEFSKMFSADRFIHPYGQVGYLPWQQHTDHTPLGAKGPDFLHVAGGLRTFTEAVDSETKVRIDNAIHEANTLVFLGFGFLEQNMQLIQAKANELDRVFASLYDVSETDQEIVSREIEQAFTRLKRDPKVARPDAFEWFGKASTCRKLMDEHRFRLRS